MLIEIIAYLTTGILAGFLSGLLGIGGGIIIVPSLAFLFVTFNLPHQHLMHLAIGTSLAIMIITTASSFRAHYKGGAVIWPTYKQLIPGLFIGVIAGAIIADFLPSNVIRIIFGIFLSIMGLKMLLALKPKASRHLPGRAGTSTAAFSIGTSSGLLGISGGAFTVPFLTTCNIDMHDAVGIAAASGLTTAIVGSISFMISGANEINLPLWSTGYVYWPAFLGVAILCPIFATLGASASRRISVTKLQRIFGIVMLLIAAHMFIN